MERAFIPELEGEWTSVSRNESPEGPGREVASIPADESFELWTQMVTIQFMKGAEATPREMMDRVLARLTAKCSELVSNVVVEDDQSVTYEWRIDECPAAPDQHEVARLIQGREGLHRIAYVRKGEEMPADVREGWLLRLAQAIVVKGEQVVFAPPEAMLEEQRRGAEKEQAPAPPEGGAPAPGS